MARRKRKAAFGAARHSRTKINRLMFPPVPSAPWLGPAIRTGPGRGRGHKFGNMHFTIYRRDEMPIGPGRARLGKHPYSSKVCIGKPHQQKAGVAWHMRSAFTTQTGDTVGCEWGSGKTPTKALANATVNLGRRLARTKRGR